MEQGWFGWAALSLACIAGDAHVYVCVYGMARYVRLGWSRLFYVSMYDAVCCYFR